MQVVDLSYTAHDIYQPVQLVNHECLYDALRPVFKGLFKFDCFQLKRYLALVELLFVTGLLVNEPLLQDLVQVGLAAVASLCLRTHQLLQTLPHFDWAHLIVVEAQSLNKFEYL